MKSSRRLLSSPLRFLATALVLCALSTAGLGMGHAVAQSTNEHEFADGEVLAWGGDWELEKDLTYVEGDLEIATLSTGRANLHVLAVPADASKAEIRDTFLEGFLEGFDNPVTIDRGDYGAVSYSLDTFQLEGVNFGGFMLLRQSSSGGDTFAYFVVAAADAFSATISNVQSVVTLDGEGFFEGIDGSGLQTQLLNADTTGTTDEPAGDTTPEATDEPTDENTPEATEESGSNGGGKFGTKSKDETPEAEETEAADETPEADNTPVSTGGDNEHVSDLLGTTLTWSDYWELNPSASQPITVNEADNTETVALSSTDENELALLSVAQFGGITGDPIDGILEQWNDPTQSASLDSPDDAFVVSTGRSGNVGWVVTQDYFVSDQGTIPLLVFQEIHYLESDGIAVIYTLRTVAPSAESVIGEAIDGVAIDGEAPFAKIDMDEVLANADS